MHTWSLTGAVAAGCFGFAAAFTAAPLQAATTCAQCFDRYDLCIERITVPSDKAKCAEALRQCRAANCP